MIRMLIFITITTTCMADDHYYTKHTKILENKVQIQNNLLRLQPLKNNNGEQIDIDVSQLFAEIPIEPSMKPNQLFRRHKFSQNIKNVEPTVREIQRNTRQQEYRYIYGYVKQYIRIDDKIVN